MTGRDSDLWYVINHFSVKFYDHFKMILSFQISPTFSSGKMKKMHKLVEECVQTMDTKLETVVKNEKEIEMRKLMGDYTMDVIASCAFATKTDTHNDPNNPFVKNAIKIFTPQIWRSLIFIGLKPLMKLLDISVVNGQSLDFFRSAVSNTCVKQFYFYSINYSID